jgi:hypothetical protein
MAVLVSALEYVFPDGGLAQAASRMARPGARFSDLDMRIALSSTAIT